MDSNPSVGLLGREHHRVSAVPAWHRSRAPSVLAAAIAVGAAFGSACADDAEHTDRYQPAQFALAPTDAVAPAVGDPCSADSHCGKSMMCVDKTLCMCRAPLAACSHRCVDVQTDRANCGICGVRCGASAQCVGGVCTDATLSPGVTALSVGNPFNISPFNGTNCPVAHEAVPVWYPDGAFGKVLTSFNRMDLGTQGNDFATGWNNYTGAERFVGISMVGALGSNTNLCRVADPWTEYSGNTNIIYSSMVAWRKTGTGLCNPNSKCMAISGISPANVPANNWNFPGVCVAGGTGTQDDGPSIQYDWAGSALWATALDLATSNVRLHIFNNCGSGVPSQAGCLLTNSPSATAGTTNGLSHSHVLVNPSTHHGIVSFIDSNSNVNVKFYSVQGAPLSTLTLFSAPFFVNAGCPGGNQAIAKCGGPAGSDCGGTNTCSRIVPRVQMAEKLDGAAGKQYLYVVWDVNCLGLGNFPNRFKSRLSVIDITNETAPIFVRHIWSSGTDLASACSTPTQEFMGTVESARGSPNVGFYFYRQGTTNNAVDPCKTDFRGKISASNTFATTTEVQLSAGTFPTVAFSGLTMGDYVGTTDGLAFGNLYPTWAEPRSSSGVAGCVQCGSFRYALVARGNIALP